MTPTTWTVEFGPGTVEVKADTWIIKDGVLEFHDEAGDTVALFRNWNWVVKEPQ